MTAAMKKFEPLNTKQIIEIGVNYLKLEMQQSIGPFDRRKGIFNAN